MPEQKKDALVHILELAGIKINITQLSGPLSFMFDPNLDENWRLLYQALGLTIVLSLALVLDRAGFFAHLKAERVKYPPLLLAVSGPENWETVARTAQRRGVFDDTPKDDEPKPNLPRRGDNLEFVCGTEKICGVVLEVGMPRACERTRKDWEQRWKKVPCDIVLLKGSDAVTVIMSERSDANGFLISWRFPRFIRKAFNRRTSGNEKLVGYITFLSETQNRVLAVAPILNKSFKDVISKFTSSESKKDS